MNTNRPAWMEKFSDAEYLAKDCEGIPRALIEKILENAQAIITSNPFEKFEVACRLFFTELYDGVDVDTRNESLAFYDPFSKFCETMNPTDYEKQQFIDQLRKQNQNTSRTRRL